jgi:hypothetical protein
MNTTPRRLVVGLGLFLAAVSGCQTWNPLTGQTLPSPFYLQHPPQFLPPSPQFPLPREMAHLEDAAAQPGLVASACPRLGRPRQCPLPLLLHPRRRRCLDAAAVPLAAWPVLDAKPQAANVILPSTPQVSRPSCHQCEYYTFPVQRLRLLPSRLTSTAAQRPIDVEGGKGLFGKNGESRPVFGCTRPLSTSTMISTSPTATAIGFTTVSANHRNCDERGALGRSSPSRSVGVVPRATRLLACSVPVRQARGRSMQARPCGQRQKSANLRHDIAGVPAAS